MRLKGLSEAVVGLHEARIRVYVLLPRELAIVVVLGLVGLRNQLRALLPELGALIRPVPRGAALVCRVDLRVLLFDLLSFEELVLLIGRVPEEQRRLGLREIRQRDDTENQLEDVENQLERQHGHFNWEPLRKDQLHDDHREIDHRLDQKGEYFGKGFLDVAGVAVIYAENL